MVFGIGKNAPCSKFEPCSQIYEQRPIIEHVVGRFVDHFVGHFASQLIFVGEFVGGYVGGYVVESPTLP